MQPFLTSPLLSSTATSPSTTLRSTLHSDCCSLIFSPPGFHISLPRLIQYLLLHSTCILFHGTHPSGLKGIPVLRLYPRSSRILLLYVFRAIHTFTRVVLTTVLNKPMCLSSSNIRQTR